MLFSHIFKVLITLQTNNFILWLQNILLFFLCQHMDYVSYSNSLAIIYIKTLPCKSRIDSSRLSKRLTQFSQTSPGKITKYLWITNPGQYSKVSFQNNCWENFFSPPQVIFYASELTNAILSHTKGGQLHFSSKSIQSNPLPYNLM